MIPLVVVKSLPGAPKGVSGLIDYRGRPVPVVDLCLLALGRPSVLRLGTRLILTGLDDGRLLALLAENATETMTRAESDFVAAGSGDAGARYLGPVTRDDRGLVQRVEVMQLLSREVREALFTELAAL